MSLFCLVLWWGFYVCVLLLFELALFMCFDILVVVWFYLGWVFTDFSCLFVWFRLEVGLVCLFNLLPVYFAFCYGLDLLVWFVVRLNCFCCFSF